VITARPSRFVRALRPAKRTSAWKTGCERPPERALARKVNVVRRPVRARLGDAIRRICAARDPEPDEPV
jgi:hypothetical protein